MSRAEAEKRGLDPFGLVARAVGVVVGIADVVLMLYLRSWQFILASAFALAILLLFFLQRQRAHRASIAIRDRAAMIHAQAQTARASGHAGDSADPG